MNNPTKILKLPFLRIALILLALGFSATAARADEVFIAGFTNGCFGTGCTPGASASIPGLTYSNSTFSGTTAGGFRGLGAAANPGANINNLGSFSLSTAPNTFNTNFTLQVTFTAPQGINGSPTTTFTGTVTGTVIDANNGGILIDFDNTPILFSFNDTNCGTTTVPGQQTTCGSGSFFFSINDLAVDPGQTVALTGQITGAQQFVGVTYTVDNTSDNAALNACTAAADDCSLRGAIANANASAGADTINFNIPGTGPHIITVGSALPDITQPVTINGLSEPDISPANTCPLPSGSLAIQIDGTSAGVGVDGLFLDLGAAGSSIRGLSITRFSDDGIEIDTSNTMVTCNYLGVAANGSTAAGNRFGMTLSNINNGTNNTVGGANPGNGNVIANNSPGDGILLLGSGNTVRGNIIRNNGDAGVDVSIGRGNRVTQNSIYSNGNLGIDIAADGVTGNDGGDGDSGNGNNLQNFPVITSANSDGTNTYVSYTLDSNAGNYTIEFFSNPACDASGNGEGEVYLGSTSITLPGTQPFSATLNTPTTPGQVITATATDSSGNTSEFSACMAVVAPNQPPVAQCKDVTVTLAPGATTASADINDGSFDPDGDQITLMYNPAGPYPAGQTVVTLTVDDGNGGTDSCTGTVTVLYRFSFFNLSNLLIPNNAPNQTTAGNDVQINFSLSGYKGPNPYSSPPVSQRINCITGNPIGAIQPIQTRGGVVNYNVSFDFYSTTWRTQANWAGTCRRLTLFLKDGTTQSLDFRFN